MSRTGKSRTYSSPERRRQTFFPQKTAGVSDSNFSLSASTRVFSNSANNISLNYLPYRKPMLLSMKEPDLSYKLQCFQVITMGSIRNNNGPKLGVLYTVLSCSQIMFFLSCLCVYSLDI